MTTQHARPATSSRFAAQANVGASVVCGARDDVPQRTEADAALDLRIATDAGIRGRYRSGPIDGQMRS